VLVTQYGQFQPHMTELEYVMALLAQAPPRARCPVVAFGIGSVARRRATALAVGAVGYESTYDGLTGKLLELLESQAAQRQPHGGQFSAGGGAGSGGMRTLSGKRWPPTPPGDVPLQRGAELSGEGPSTAIAGLAVAAAAAAAAASDRETAAAAVHAAAPTGVPEASR